MSAKIYRKGDLGEFHDFNHQLRTSVRYDTSLYEFYSKTYLLETPSQKRSRYRYSVKEKETITKSYNELGAFAAVAREFGLNESTVRKIVKQAKVDRKRVSKVVGGESYSGNQKGKLSP